MNSKNLWGIFLVYSTVVLQAKELSNYQKSSISANVYGITFNTRDICVWIKVDVIINSTKNVAYFTKKKIYLRDHKKDKNMIRMIFCLKKSGKQF